MKHYDLAESDEGGFDLNAHYGYKFTESDSHYLWCEDQDDVDENDKTVKCNCFECKEFNIKSKMVNDAIQKGITGEFKVSNDYKWTPTINGVLLQPLSIHR